MPRHDTAPETVRKLALEGGALRAQAWPRAQRVLKAFRAEAIVSSVSPRIGVALTSRQLVALVEDGRGTFGDDLVSPAALPLPEDPPDLSPTGRMWASRWRKRFRFRLGHLGTEPPITTAERRSRALHAWQWFNHACDEAHRHGEQFVRLNLDETSVAFFHGGQTGDIPSRRRLREAAQRAPRGQATRNDRRLSITHVGLVCDRQEWQPLLPQYLIVNERACAKVDEGASQATLPPNVFLFQMNSAWDNRVIRRVLLKDIRAALEPVASAHRIIMLLATVSFHYDEAVLRLMRKLRMQPVMVPASCTDFLQPLDAYVFALYKRVLRQRYQMLQVHVGRCVLPTDVWIGAVVYTIKTVLEGKDWSRAFDGTGFGARQRLAGDRVLEATGLTNPPDVPPGGVTEELLQDILPRRRRVPPPFMQ